MTKIITSTDKFIDIDGLACAVAYRELLTLKGEKSDIVFTVDFNQSVSETIRKWAKGIKRSIPKTFKKEDCEYILLDISDPAHFDICVDNDKIIEVFDHHFGFETMWKEKLGKNSHIEAVGATSTLIFEQIKKNGLIEKLSGNVARLLYTAIVSHTLYFHAQITTKRDKMAANELLKMANLPADWLTQYYFEIEKFRHENPGLAIENDTKFQEINGIKYAIGQAELWDSKPFVFNYKDQIMNSLKRTGTESAFLTAPSISEGRNYIIAIDPKVKALLNKVIGAVFEGDFGQTDKLWLRKEIIREIQECTKNEG